MKETPQIAGIKTAFARSWLASREGSTVPNLRNTRMIVSILQTAEQSVQRYQARQQGARMERLFSATTESREWLNAIRNVEAYWASVTRERDIIREETNQERDPYMSLLQEMNLLEQRHAINYKVGEGSDVPKLILLTEPIEIVHSGESYPLGRYRFQLGADRDIFIEQEEGYVDEAEGDHCHPHVSDEGYPCMGSSNDAFHLAINQGRLSDAADLLLAMLENYSNSNPYEPIGSFRHRIQSRRTRCHNCGDAVSDSTTCSTCDEEFCDDCLYECFGCSDTVCRECALVRESAASGLFLAAYCPTCGKYCSTCGECFPNSELNEGGECKPCSLKTEPSPREQDNRTGFLPA